VALHFGCAPEVKRAGEGGGATKRKTELRPRHVSHLQRWGVFIPGYPALTRWANLWRAYGATLRETLWVNSEGIHENRAAFVAVREDICEERCVW
jgi:hypothetical protein